MSTVESSARGRDANIAYLYERIAEGDHEHAEQPDSPHVMRRVTSHDAAQLVRGIIAARDDRARTAHQVAASTDREGDLPRPGTQPLRPPRPRRSIQADGLPALARGNPGTGDRAAALDRPTHRSRPQPSSGPRPRHRLLAVQAFDRTAFLPRPLDGWGAGFPSSGGVETGYGRGFCGRGRRRRCGR